MSKENMKEQTQKQQENKKEDKKALHKFMWILVGAFAVGLVLGFVMCIVKEMLLESSVKSTFLKMLSMTAVYGGYLYTTVLVIASIILYKKSRKEYAVWDEEDEEALSRMETKISYVLWFSNLIMYGAYFFFAVGIWATDIFGENEALGMDTTGLIIGFGAVFLHIAYGMVAASLIQQKSVNFGKELSPEKKGSVYDIKFQDKWMKSCDEAERYTVYKCSFKTFKTMQIVGIVLWLICLLGQMFLETGVFATIIVTIYLIVQTSVYSVQGIYFAKHPSEVMK